MQSRSTAIVFRTTSKARLCPEIDIARATLASSFRVSTFTSRPLPSVNHFNNSWIGNAMLCDDSRCFGFIGGVHDEVVFEFR